MKLKYKFIYQPVGDTTIAVAVGDESKDYNGMINLNETGIEIMKLFEQDITIDDAVARLKEDYEADDDTLRNAVVSIVEKLDRDNLLI